MFSLCLAAKWLHNRTRKLVTQPLAVYSFAHKNLNAYKRWIRFRRLKERIANQEFRRIVVGASGVCDEGWIPTEIELLNVLDLHDWDRYFHPDSIDAILAEHVWEHLTKEEGIVAARMCFTYLKRGGYLRLAVPDGLHPDQNYIEWVKVGGTGPGADNHKVLYTYRTLTEILEVVGFRVDLYEYFDETGRFHYREWDPRQGMIHRSKRFDERNSKGQLNYTSIVLDAFKERVSRP